MEISNTLGPIHYAYCECHVWPLSTLNKVGVCGFCLTKPQADFQCINCGHEEHADVNAAKNIAAGHVVNDCEVGELSPKCSSKQTVGG